MKKYNWPRRLDSSKSRDVRLKCSDFQHKQNQKKKANFLKRLDLVVQKEQNEPNCQSRDSNAPESGGISKWDTRENENGPKWQKIHS